MNICRVSLDAYVSSLDDSRRKCRIPRYSVASSRIVELYASLSDVVRIRSCVLSERKYSEREIQHVRIDSGSTNPTAMNLRSIS